MESFRRSYIVSILLVFGLSLTLTGCGLQDLIGNKNKKDTAKQKTEDRQVIGLMLDANDPNQLLIKQAVKDMAEKDNIQVITLESEGKSSQGKGLLQGTKVLICQGQGEKSVLEEAKKENIPVIAINQIPEQAKATGLIYSDQGQKGELMARTLEQEITEGDVVVLQENPSDQGSQELLVGHRAVLGKNSKIALHVIANRTAGVSTAKAALAEYIQAHKDTIKGILAHSEALAAMANQVLKEVGLEKQVVLIGGQANLQSLQRMTTGSQAADMDTSPYLQGAQAYQWANKVLKGEHLEVEDSLVSEQGIIPVKRIAIKTVTSDNLEQVKSNYAKSMSLAEQAQQKEEAETAKTEKKDNSNSAQGENKSNGDKTGQASEKAQGGTAEKEGSPSGQAGIPSGTSKVNESIKTETTREYLDDKGQVLGTEKSSKEEMRTLPPENLSPQSGSGQGAGEGEGKADINGGDGGGGGGSSGDKEQNKSEEA